MSAGGRALHFTEQTESNARLTLRYKHELTLARLPLLFQDVTFPAQAVYNARTIIHCEHAATERGRRQKQSTCDQNTIVRSQDYSSDEYNSTMGASEEEHLHSRRSLPSPSCRPPFPARRLWRSGAGCRSKSL